MTISSKMKKAQRREHAPARILISFSGVRGAQATQSGESHEQPARAANGVTVHGQRVDMVAGTRNRPRPDNSANKASKANPPLIQAGSGFCPFTFASGNRA